MCCFVVLAALLACPSPRGSVALPPVDTGSGDSGEDTADTTDTADTADDYVPNPITVRFVGSLVTVTGGAFGATEEALQDAAITGELTYDAAAPDEEDDHARYESAHAGVGFHAEFAGATIDGSGDAVVRVVATDGESGSDCFYFEDGPQLGEQGLRHLTVNGAESEVATVWIAFCDDGLAASGEAGPDPFLWVDVGMPHTFALDEEDATALVQLTSIEVE